MPRKPHALHVRTHLENVAEMCQYLQDLPLDKPIPPVMRDWIVQNKLYTKAILRKHAERKTRKDVYIHV